MTTNSFVYVDVAASRIQQWLDRTASLRLRRGASYLLAQAASQAEIAKLLSSSAAIPPSVEWNQEAGNLSGVASLRFKATDPAADERLARQVAVAVANHIRKSVPMCPISADWATGEAYVDVHNQKKPLFSYPGGAEEAFVGRECRACRSGRATHADVDWPASGQRYDLCEDCFQRLKAPIDQPESAGESDRHKLRGGGFLTAYQAASWNLPRPQADLMNGVQQLREEGGNQGKLYLPTDFSGLADEGNQVEGDARTQVATIYADGNRMGQAIRKWAAGFDDSAASGQQQGVTKANIVKAIDTATKSALLHATTTTFDLLTDGDVRVPVIAHIADGDDVLVSVPATHGWRFARTLMDAFTSELKEKLPGAFEPNWPTLSVGLVFHHQSHPFSDVTSKAALELGRAKSEVRGKEASLSFLDLTADGESSTFYSKVADSGEARPPVTAAQLTDWEPALDELAGVAPAKRNNVTQLLRQTVEDRQPASVEKGETAIDALTRKLGEWNAPGLNRAVAVATEPQGTTQDEANRRLRLLVDIARWWPAVKEGK